MIGLLYDVHGNLPALEAVLADAQEQGVERYLLGGDYGLAGAWPRECVERLKELDAVWIRGNVDRWCADPDSAPRPVGPVVDRCRELLGHELVAELGALPEQTTIDGVRYCHASPVSDMRSFFPVPGEDDEELVEGVGEGRLVFGHTHVQFRREGPGGIELVNPGSVGAPWDGDHRAAWAVAGDELDMRRVEYDWQAAVDAVRRRLGETGELPARRIEQARFDPD